MFFFWKPKKMRKRCRGTSVGRASAQSQDVKKVSMRTARYHMMFHELIDEKIMMHMEDFELKHVRKDNKILKRWYMEEKRTKRVRLVSGFWIQLMTLSAWELPGLPYSSVKSTLQSLESSKSAHVSNMTWMMILSFISHYFLISRFLLWFQVISWHFNTDLPRACLCRPSWAETLAHTSRWIGTRKRCWKKLRRLQLSEPSIPASKGPPSTIPFPKPDKSPQLPAFTSPVYSVYDMILW